MEILSTSEEILFAIESFWKDIIKNDSSGRFSPERAAYEYHSIQTPLSIGELVINELMAKNESTVQDLNGDYDDWIELYNPTSSSISTAGLFLSDDSTNLMKWPIPEQTLSSDEYLIIWADEESDEEGMHANFKLSSNGEQLFLSYNSSETIDSISFSSQNPDMSFARSPNGTGSFIELIPSYNANNDHAQSTTLNQVDFKCFPNPVNNFLKVTYSSSFKGHLKLCDIGGKCLKEIKVSQKNRIN